MAETFLNEEGLGIYDEEIKKYINQSVEQTVVQKDSFLKFPTVGSETVIYIDTTESIIYRWSDADLKYYKISSDLSSIEVINGNF